MLVKTKIVESGRFFINLVPLIHYPVCNLLSFFSSKFFVNRLEELLHLKVLHMKRWVRFCHYTKTMEAVYPYYKNRIKYYIFFFFFLLFSINLFLLIITFFVFFLLVIFYWSSKMHTIEPVDYHLVVNHY